MVRLYCLIVSVFCLCGCSRSGELKRSAANQSLEEIIGGGGIEGIKEIRAYRSDIADTSTIWFTFKCEESTFQLISSRGFEKTSIDPVAMSQVSIPRDFRSINPNQPSWWLTTDQARVDYLFYRYQPSNGNLQTRFVYYWREPGADTVYLCSSVWR